MGVEVDSARVDAVMRAEAASRKAPDNRSDPAKSTPRPPQRRGRAPVDWTEEARKAAAASESLEALKTAIEAFEGCPLKASCEHSVVFDGVQGADLMVIGEGPGAEEDRRGLPFVGKAGQLLDRMLAAINRSRTENTFITNVNYWRTPSNRNPDAEELDVCRPFVERMIVLGKPKLIIAAGGVPAKALLGTSAGIMKLRGTEHVFEAQDGTSIPLIPILHPAYLLRRPQDKSRAWRDLLLVEQRLNELG
ncbi:uracil-DNA glycosylase [Hyphomonas johnsonii]|jgi:DNA polymerase|nr:uracil-DNA glycosylase [Hyphomonas johnsonii]